MLNALVTADDLRILDEAVQALYRAHDNANAVKLAVVALKLRSSSRIAAHDAFVCDVDESVGMAEVVELQGYSRKAPCA